MAVIRSPLGRARGMGSSKHGVGHFIAQRVTAVALIFLVLWALASALTLANGIRHLVWDAGYGFKPQTATNTAWLVIVVAIVATAAFWGLILFTGAS